MPQIGDQEHGIKNAEARSQKPWTNKAETIERGNQASETINHDASNRGAPNLETVRQKKHKPGNRPQKPNTNKSEKRDGWASRFGKSAVRIGKLANA